MSINDVVNTDGSLNYSTIGGFKDRLDGHDVSLAQIATQGLLAESYTIQTPETDDTARLNRAITDCLSKNASLILGNKTYNISTGLTINGSINIFGQGELSSIQSSDTTKSILKITNANGVILRGFKLIGTASTRNSTQYGLFVTGNRITVQSVSVLGSAAAGIFAVGLVDSKIIGCDVRNNLADGIHLTNKCQNVSVLGNTTSNTGDDGIAVVSYQGDGGMCTQIEISNNIVNSSKARGITHVGGNNITIANNTINGTSSSGVLVIQDNTYNTYAPSNTIISKNQILNVGTVLPLGGNQFGIEVTSASVSCVMDGNIIRDGSSRGFDVAGSENIISNNTIINQTSGNQVDAQTGIVIANNRFDSCGSGGLAVISNTNANIIGNVFYNNNTQGNVAGDNLYLQGCTKTNIVGNFSIDTNATPKVRNAMTIYNCTDVELSGNKIDCGTLGIAFISTTGVLNKDTILATSDPSDTTTYKTGQRWYNYSNINSWIFNGTSWQTTGLSTNNPSFTGKLTSTTITTGNTQVINPTASLIYVGNPSTAMHLESNGSIDCTTNSLNANSLSENGLTLSNKYAPKMVGVPASATANGTTGQMAQDGSYLYICTATNTWRRVAIVAW